MMSDQLTPGQRQGAELFFGHGASWGLGGAVVTETVFSWPGVGRLMVQAITTRDFPIVQATVMIVAFIFVIVNLLVDISYAWLDPRIHYT